MQENKAQSRAISHNKGPMMVLAGPGSGKTYLIVKRIEYLIQEAKVRPEEILVITFTRYAAKEMRERFIRQIKGPKCPVTFGTFHGIYYGILKWAYGLNSSNIFSEKEKYGLLKEITNTIELDIEDEQDFLQGIAAEIGIIKNNRMELETFESENCPNDAFREIFTIYEARRKKLRKIDFDDMLVLTYELFTKHPDILAKWQNKFRYILIDEFQDINKVQYDVIRMLAEPENNLFIVGDDDQSIYKFRGARPEIMLGFPKDYPQTKQVALELNYRSTKAIIDGAGRVIHYNTSRFKKHISTENEQGHNIHVQEVRDPIEESKYVLEQIQDANKRGVPMSEIAVLFRTNICARTMVETMMEYNVPFSMREHIPNIYEHFIGKDLQTYLRMALGSRKRSDFLSIMNRPKRYMSRECLPSGNVSFEELRSFYCDKEWMQDRIDQFDVDLRMIQNMAPYGAITYIRKRIGYDDFLKEYADFRKMNLEDLKEIIQEIEEKAKQFQTIEEWFSYIEEYGEELARQAKYSETAEDAVTLLTMHGAKGLEYDTVMIIGANEDIVPYKKAVLPEDMEEERRMFYVAMTRAKKRLYITYTKEKNGKEMLPSRFVHELLTIT